jgi:hypothetical protein
VNFNGLSQRNHHQQVYEVRCLFAAATAALCGTFHPGKLGKGRFPNLDASHGAEKTDSVEIPIPRTVYPPIQKCAGTVLAACMILNLKMVPQVPSDPCHCREQGFGGLHWNQ